VHDFHLIKVFSFFEQGPGTTITQKKKKKKPTTKSPQRFPVACEEKYCRLLTTLFLLHLTIVLAVG
jgi:hypothetical protein